MFDDAVDQFLDIAGDYDGFVFGTPVHWGGATPEQVRKDLEGMQIMRILGKNMAFFLKCKEAGLTAGVPLPKQETISFTNFIRDRAR